ncbi:hypothetical protein J2Y48_004075 [Mycoplana sp. BE70]|uniref:hypothetical protein n=1 Tax=Mycoplana sp. BE70 TaxID=2817775 RepID=UPI002862E06B|nr:hypothetical protein [Mycoplana sp. BE70]MDR6758767.1 hypothetical protein [Mycoplana sp. BE70]
MALTTDAYYGHLKACLNPDFIQDRGESGSVTLKEKIDGVPKPLTVTFPFEGQAFSVNLDLKPIKKGDDPRLFRFLDDDAKPWARKCDFVVFHRMSLGIYAYLIEFKSNGIDQTGIKAQLDAGTNWLRSMKRVVEHYFGHSHPLFVQKFVFSSNTNPAAYLDADGKYLRADPAIRFYHYDALNGLALGDLENNMADEI